jgi:ferrous iron transport protein A
MDCPLSDLIPLPALPPGIAARIAEVRGGRGFARRLLGLGLRVGSEVRVLHHRGRGLVLSCGDTRIALGGGIADKLWVDRPGSAAPGASQGGAEPVATTATPDPS